MTVDHLELSGEAYAGLIDATRIIWNTMYHHKANMPMACYQLVMRELEKCSGIIKDIVIVKAKPHDFNIKDFDVSGSN